MSASGTRLVHPRGDASHPSIHSDPYPSLSLSSLSPTPLRPPKHQLSLASIVLCLLVHVSLSPPPTAHSYLPRVCPCRSLEFYHTYYSVHGRDSG